MGTAAAQSLPPSAVPKTTESSPWESTEQRIGRRNRSRGQERKVRLQAPLQQSQRVLDRKRQIRAQASSLAGFKTLLQQGYGAFSPKGQAVPKRWS